MLLKVILILLLGIAGVFCLGVLLILNLVKMKAKPKIERLDLSPMPEVSADFYNEYNQVLISEGFEFVGDYSLITDPGKGTKMRIFRNLEEGIAVSLYQLQNENMRKMMISFETEFEDGFIMTTTTYREPSIFKHQNRAVYRLPDLNWTELLKYHRENLNNEKQKRKVALRKMGERVEESTIRSYQEELEEQIGYGILKYVKKTDTYYFTLYGAVRSILKILEFSFSKGNQTKTGKTMFDTKYRVKNKKKERIKSFNVMGFVLLIMGLFAFGKRYESSAAFYFRLITVLLGSIIVVITSIILRSKEFKDDWK